MGTEEIEGRVVIKVGEPLSTVFFKREYIEVIPEKTNEIFSVINDGTKEAKDLRELCNGQGQYWLEGGKITYGRFGYKMLEGTLIGSTAKNLESCSFKIIKNNRFSLFYHPVKLDKDE